MTGTVTGNGTRTSVGDQTTPRRGVLGPSSEALSGDLIDTHAHFWDHREGSITWAWLRRGRLHPVLGDIEAIKRKFYLPDDLVADARPMGLLAVVHVEATMGGCEPINETHWLERLAQESGHPGAIVASVKVRDTDLPQSLDAHLAASPAVRGVRDQLIEKPAFDRPFVRGLRELAKRDLLLEVAAHPHQLDELTAVADRVPDLTIVLEHAGRPAAVNYGEWSRGIASLAQRDNVICKLSGLGLGDKTWDRIAIADRVARCIDAFGPERSMFGSNWPIDGLFTDYHTAVEDIRSGLPAADVQQVFVETARKVYKLMLPRAS